MTGLSYSVPQNSQGILTMGAESGGERELYKGYGGM